MVGNIIFPLLLICGFFGIIILVGIVFSYLGLKWFHEEITKCPECGRRGAGELVDTKVLDSKVRTEWKDAQNLLGRRSSERRRIRVSEKTYEDHFECEHCGHQWAKTARETKREPV